MQNSIQDSKSSNTANTAPNQDDLNYAAGVLQKEADGVLALAAALKTDVLNAEFLAAISAIENMLSSQTASGRVIIAGVGKSGHIGRKIAATMASTGTPSYYVHPGEASHGDLGMITEKDVVIIFSNSGENSELSDLIYYTRRFSIPLICVTSNPESTLAKHSDIRLVMPKVKEACPNGLAPTTSTTMMIALGDALALALLKRRGLSPEEFKIFHPGGKLGQALLTVSEIMLPPSDLPTVSADTKMGDALILMTEKNTGSIVIINADNQVQGIITDGDLKRHMDNDLLNKTVSDIMNTVPKSIAGDLLAVEAIDMMLNQFDQPISNLLVMDDNQHLLGLIRIQDCLKAGIV